MAECEICKKESEPKKNYLASFFVAFMCLFIGACCHGLRTSGDPVKFKIGVAIGVTMIAAAVGFGIAGLVMLKKRKPAKPTKASNV